MKLSLCGQPAFQCSMPACEAPRSVLCSSVKDGIGISVLFKHIGKCPIRKRVDQTNRFQICFCKKDRRSQRIVRVTGEVRARIRGPLFSDQLNFRFVYDNHSRQEIIRNLHPRRLPMRPGDALHGSPPAISRGLRCRCEWFAQPLFPDPWDRETANRRVQILGTKGHWSPQPVVISICAGR
jgi:hypothetical protein